MPKLDMIGGCSSYNIIVVPSISDVNHPGKIMHRKLKKNERARYLSALNHSSSVMPPMRRRHRPIVLPCLSFFFFAVRTLLKGNSTLEGNCNAGRWNDRASCLVRRVLYCVRWINFIGLCVYPTYKGELKLLRRVRMMDVKVLKGLPHALSSNILRNFVLLGIGKIEFIAWLVNLRQQSFLGTCDLY